MNLDLIASIGCFWLALILFGLHTLSGLSRPSWMNMPGYVRRGYLVTGAMFLWRAVNLATLPADHLGHPNVEGLMVLFSLGYMVTAQTVWVARRRLPDHGWDRIEWIRALMQRNPEIVPAPMTLIEVAEEHTARGAVVSTPPDPEGTMGHFSDC